MSHAMSERSERSERSEPRGGGRPLRVAVVGSGPAGLYAAEALVAQAQVPLEVTVLDRLPTPYGLVRYGVAPDHEKIKSIASTLRRVLEDPSVHFLGGVELGADLTREELHRHFDAVLYATGAALDRRLDIPGEDLPGSHPATEFVSWYSGHPDAAQPFGLDARSVAVVGAGNVAIDVVRILAKTSADLQGTDLPTPVLDALAHSAVTDIHLIARRGPAQAKFTPKELRELGELTNADVLVDPDELDTTIGPLDRDVSRTAAPNLAVLRDWAASPATGKPRRVHLRFWLRPTAILGGDRVEALRVERTRLDDAGVLYGTGEYEDIPVQLVLRSVGYRSVALPGVPFDERAGVVPNVDGRVIDASGALVPGEYVAGWLKRGPTGVIGTNKGDAVRTVRALLEDVARDGTGTAGATDGPADGSALEDLLRARGTRFVRYDGWLAIDAEERSRGLAGGRDRCKVADWETLRRLGAGSGPAERDG